MIRASRSGRPKNAVPRGSKSPAMPSTATGGLVGRGDAVHIRGSRFNLLVDMRVASMDANGSKPSTRRCPWISSAARWEPYLVDLGYRMRSWGGRALVSSRRYCFSGNGSFPHSCIVSFWPRGGPEYKLQIIIALLCICHCLTSWARVDQVPQATAAAAPGCAVWYGIVIDCPALRPNGWRSPGPSFNSPWN
jgi:hypothetical protein